jgi:diguanylate cyclase (GGDEF)-like protein/PAS domain S-box-containing protein
VPDPTSHEPLGPDGDRHAPCAVPGLPPGPALDALAFDAVPVALAVTGLDGQWVRVNPALCELLGYPAEQLLGDTYRSLTPADDVRLDEEAVALLLERGRGPSIEKRYRHADGHLIWVRVTASLIRDPAGAPIGAVAAVEDIAELRHRHAELSRLALHDPLTGVRNRALFEEDVDRALRARDRDGGVVAVLYLDVDDFKQINDEHGHEAGDLVLIVLSTRLRDALREEDTVARIGGDEFVVVAHLPTADHAEEFRDRIEAVCAEPVVLAERSVSVRVSVGMAAVDFSGCVSAQALAAADAAMYARKRGRKKGVVVGRHP